MSNGKLLATVIGRNTYCGPAAIAAITGVTTDEAASHIRAVSGREKVFGVSDWELREAMELLGWRMQRRNLRGRPTLRKWLDETTCRGMNKYVLQLTRHYVAVQGSWLVDSKHREGVVAEDCKLRLKQVRKAWLAEPTGKPKEAGDVAAAKATVEAGLGGLASLLSF